jgi:hypothetical protein
LQKISLKRETLSTEKADAEKAQKISPEFALIKAS